VATVVVVFFGVVVDAVVNGCVGDVVATVVFVCF
jgi:hypothetical protein